MMASELYVVTGISRLTGERVQVSSPHTLTKAMEMRDRMAARQHCRSAYSKLKVESYVREATLW